MYVSAGSLELLKPLDICSTVCTLWDRRRFSPSCSHICDLLAPPVPPGYFTVASGSALRAPNASRADGNIIVPKRVGVSAIRLPAEVDGSGLRLDAAPLPLGRVRVAHARLGGQAGNDVAVQPRLNRAVSSEVILEALPAASGEGGRRGDALRRKVGEGGIIGLAVVHQNLALPTDAEVLLGALGRVRHGDKGDVRVGQGLRCLSRQG